MQQKWCQNLEILFLKIFLEHYMYLWVALILFGVDHFTNNLSVVIQIPAKFILL